MLQPMLAIERVRSSIVHRRIITMKFTLQLWKTSRRKAQQNLHSTNGWYYTVKIIQLNSLAETIKILNEKQKKGKVWAQHHQNSSTQITSHKHYKHITKRWGKRTEKIFLLRQNKTRTRDSEKGKRKRQGKRKKERRRTKGMKINVEEIVKQQTSPEFN